MDQVFLFMRPTAKHAAATLMMFASSAALLGCEEKAAQTKPPTPAATASAPAVLPPAHASAAALPSGDARGAGGGAPQQTPTEIRYRVETYEPAEPNGEPSRAVVATRGKEELVVVPRSEGACLDILVERDLDGDGWTDALFEHALSCGGNLTAPDYYFVAGTPEQKFVAQELGSQWERPSVETWRGRPSVVIVTNNEGVNVNRPEETTRRYVFEHRQAKLVEEVRSKELKALAELRSEAFVGASADEERTLDFDLDGDGKTDQVVATLWERWGRMFWRVKFADGRSTEQHAEACKRLGVLSEKTKAHHDLVCDFDTRYRWNGKNYEQAKAGR